MSSLDVHGSPPSHRLYKRQLRHPRLLDHSSPVLSRENVARRIQIFSWILASYSKLHQCELCLSLEKLCITPNQKKRSWRIIYVKVYA